MYLDYFGLKRKPFLITPDPVFLYPSAGHQQALAHLQYGLQREGGFLLLTGEVGTGKTTLCRLFMDNLPDDFRLAYLLNTRLETEGMLSGICRELGIDPGGDRDINKLVEQIYDNLLDAHARGKHTLVVIEEAQNLSADVLETLRLLTNLETSATKLLHILLIGQPELLDTLGQPTLRQLNQRVVSRSHLGALGKREIAGYLHHRLKMAGTERPLFTAGAIARIHAWSGGIPRLVNLLAEHCLMGAYANGRSQVTAAIVRGASREIAGTLQSPLAKKRRWLPAAALLLVGMGAALYLGMHHQDGSTSRWIDVPAISRADRVGAETALASMPEAGRPSPVGGENDQAPPQPVAGTDGETPVPTVPDESPNAFRRLLALGGVDAEVGSEAEMCRVARTHGLRCIRSEVTSRDKLLAVGRPMVVRLYTGGDGIELFLLQDSGSASPRLANSSGERRGQLADVLERMAPEVLYLWRPPPGYTKPLIPGESNPLLVERVVALLTAGGYPAENLVTGGVYSDYLAALVKEFQADNKLAVDGILGERTLLRLTRFGDPADRLSDLE